MFVVDSTPVWHLPMCWRRTLPTSLNQIPASFVVVIDFAVVGSSSSAP